MIKFEKPSRIDYIEDIVWELINSKQGDYWCKVITWFSRYETKDRAIQFVWDSLFTNKYIQSIYMYKGMLKFILYLYKAEFEDDFKYEYSSNRINIIDKFWKTNFKLSTGAFSGKPFVMEANQVYKIARIYGFAYKESHKPKIYQDKGIKFMVNRFYDVETRKNGKSEWVAGLGVFVQQNPFTNDAQPEVFASGPVKEQSDIIRKKAMDFVKGQEILSKEYEAINTRRFLTYGGGTFKSLPFNPESLEGQNPSLAINTEYHQAKSDLMVNSQESAINASRPNSLMLFDTTKGEGINGVAHLRENQYKDYIDKQLFEPNEVLFENISTFMAELDPDDDYADFLSEWDNNIFRKSTPMLGLIIALDALQQEWKAAKNNPTQRREFLIKKGGRWIGSKVGLFEFNDLIDSNEKWKQHFKLEDLDDQPCVVAIDLANTTDTNAVTTIFKGNHENKDIFLTNSHIFVPRETLEQRADKERKPYHKWIQDGFVTLAGEKAIDFGKIAAYINNILHKYKVVKILYDKAFFHNVKTYLVDKYKIDESLFLDVPQRAVELSSPMEDLIKKVVDKEFYYFNNPVTIDHFLNMAPQVTSNGLLYFQKTKQEQRIDIFATNVIGMKMFNELKPIGSSLVEEITTWTF